MRKLLFLALIDVRKDKYQNFPQNYIERILKIQRCEYP